ncbi:MAG: hypothetical protein Q8S42_31905 [Archangium sp.]|nr:hypothetical protein [Archangium sp.]
MFVIADDIRTAETPPSIGAGRVASTSSMVVIGTQMAADGPTTIALLSAQEAPDGVPAIDLVLSTPRRKLRLFSTEGTPIYSVDTEGLTTRLRVWKNHADEPDEIRVVVG